MAIAGILGVVSAEFGVTACVRARAIIIRSLGFLSRAVGYAPGQGWRLRCHEVGIPVVAYAQTFGSFRQRTQWVDRIHTRFE